MAKQDPVCLQGGTWTLIPYFCGNDDFCQKPTKQAVDQAMANVRKSYLVVGILEDYERFLKLVAILMTPFFIGRTHFCSTKLRIRVIFRSGNLYSLCSPGNQDYQKIIYFLNFFHPKRSKWAIKF
mgnify:CR=1 FL=1